MQRNVRRIADLWKGQWDTQESMHSIRKWMQSHTHTHTHACTRPPSCAGIQRAHLDPLFLSCVSTGSPLTCETESVSRSVVIHSLRPRGLQPARRLCPWDSPGKNTGVGCCFLLQGIFPSWAGSRALQVDSLPSEQLGKPRYTKWHYTNTYI